MKNKWVLLIEKSYIDMTFVFQNAEHMARFLTFFMDVYVEETEKDKLKITVRMLDEDETEKMEENE